ncbi:apoptosis-inducing factor 1, mitochondrial-like [Achroia grisella]|uniref:apoptosis-inducing factor 1, mitochondrial-like n=1 Tax=Achroia grisella TaxID=688607 RepID=UPI0027D2E8A0|nr:apoptosis-inducing factor 1, mitochondrial-like [Achroia grisella]
MLRAVSTICIESQALEVLVKSWRTRRDVFKLFRTQPLSTCTPDHNTQTVVRSNAPPAEEAPVGPAPPRAPPPPPPPPSPPPQRGWPAAAAALAVTLSLGGVYFYRKLTNEKNLPAIGDGLEAERSKENKRPDPATGAELPQYVDYLLVGAGTASFAAMRAIRGARPDASVLLVGDEPELPYMRPPLSKELWREPELAVAAALDGLSFRQWNGRRRSLAYEPAAFYSPPAALPDAGGAAVARGWRVERLDVVRHEAELRAPAAAATTSTSTTLRYGRCLVATGARPRRVAALAGAAAAGRSLVLRDLRDLRRLAAAAEAPHVRRVVVVGGGFLACELSAALAARLAPAGTAVTQVFREPAPLAAVLPRYLADEAARRLRAAGVALAPAAEVEACAVEPAALRLRLAGGGELAAELAVECAGVEPDEALARASGLETHPRLGGVVVSAELQARADVFAAGDVACFYDVALGRRRVEHHDHAVVSGRLAGENMAAAGPPRPYTHQSMFWSDLGPDLGYEAIGIIDSRLPTVGVFSAEAVTDAEAPPVAATAADGVAGAAPSRPDGSVAVRSGGEASPVRSGGEASPVRSGDEAAARRYERGVVFYLREKRIVGVLLWNLFNRMHVARQVLAQGEFDDLFEVAKLFSLHEED